MNKFVKISIVVFAALVIGKMAHAAVTVPPNLMQGSSGTQVMNLQTALGGLTVDGKFGPMTKAAVMAYQSSHGLTADGIVGPMTAASINGGGSIGGGTGGCPVGYTCAPTTPTTPVTCPVGYTCTPTGGGSGSLEGGAGSVTLTASGQYSSEDVGEGSEDVKILQVDVEADDNSDVELTTAKVEFHQATAADDRDLSDYASEVSVWLDGEEVGRADVDDFSESTTNYFSKSISLSDAIINSGETGELVIAITANDSLDSGDIDTDDWRVDLLSLRFTDGDGVTTTESGSAAGVAAAGTYGTTFDFDSFATANDAELTLTLENDEINDIHVLDADDTLDSEHEVLSALFDASGDSDVWVDEVSGTFTTTGETDESAIIISAWIEVDGVRISDKEDVPAGGAVTWNNLDWTIEAGDEAEAIFVAEVQEVNGALDDADTIQLTIGTASTVAEDGAGETLTATGGNLVGGAHVFFDNGIALVGHTGAAQAYPVDLANNDRIELTLTFDVYNFGDTTLYIPNVDTMTNTTTAATTTAPSTSQGVGYHIQTAGTVTPPSAQVIAVLSEEDSDLTLGTNSYELKAGKTGTFELQISVSADENPSIDNVGFRAILAGVGWATSDTATSANVYTYNLADYNTPYATIGD